MPQTLKGKETLLLKQPTISADLIAFLYASELWIAERDGSNPKRLTAQKGIKSNPIFSPDGEWIAFSGNYDGNLSVYVIPKAGGSPKRLTYHPGEDYVRGWTSDGRSVLFSSGRSTISQRTRRLYTIPVEGGFPEPMPMDLAERGAFSPDGKRIAYTAYPEAFWSWKRYRGGMTLPIWVLDLDTYEHIEITHENASDTFPCWVGKEVYFLSDRCGVMNIFRYSLSTAEVTQITTHTDFDVRSLTSGAGWLAYEQAGRVHLLDPANKQAKALSITIDADLPETRLHYTPATSHIQKVGISPTGLRAIFEARGEIFTIPVKKGDARNLTQTPGICERDPSWSPDGKSIAYFSDESGEYALVITDQKGVEKSTFPLGKRSFFYSPIWSPDSQKIVFTDKALNLSYIYLKTQKIFHVDVDTYDHPERSLNPTWSPDSQWLAYTKRLDNHIRAVILYDLASQLTHQVTDGMSDATNACWSKDGKYLFFAGSSNYGLNTGWLDMSSMNRPYDQNLYVIVLSKEGQSLVAPESDEEMVSGNENTNSPEEGEKPDPQPVDEEKSADPVEIPKVTIDLEKIDQRIQALPVPARKYLNLQSIPGKLFYLEFAPSAQPIFSDIFTINLHTYDIKERKDEVFLEKIQNYWVCADGKKLLYQTADKPPRYAVVGTDKKPEGKPEDFLKVEALEIPVDPRAEWRQIFRETYRIHRDYFYDATLHGLDWEGAYQKYLPFLEHVGHRDDLNYLLAELSGELVVGHVNMVLGDIPSPDMVTAGLLGADFEVVDGFYRIKRIYPGLNWHPELRSPLTEPGVNISEGEYILAVNGRHLRYPTNLYQLFEKTAGQIIDLRLSPTLSDKDARTVTVKTIESETPLRLWNWVEGNRKKVELLSNGRAAYIYMANTGVDGFDSFNRYYYAQLDKEAVVLDERFNGGGFAADYVIDMLDKPLLSYWATREGREFTTPNASIFGPKVMIINELAGSGGDAMPLFFRRRGLGKLVGKRTWGGLIGIYDYPVLMDGGFLSSPRLAIYSPEGEWEVENVGVAPDIEVEQTPNLVIAGHDPQLEKAVEVVMAELEDNPQPRKGRPKPALRAQ